MTQSERIKKLRKELHLNQANFGARVGVKGNTIGNYEVGLRKPSDAVIFSICREFNVNEDWLRNGTGEMFKKVSKEDELAYMATHLSQMFTAEDWAVIKKFVDVLSEMAK